MSANVEFFIKVDEIKTVKQDVKQFDKINSKVSIYYDKDGNEIDVYFRRHWVISDHSICANNKEILLSDLEKPFKSRNSMKLEFSIAQGNLLYASYRAKDSVDLTVCVEVLEEFLYDVFGKELEF